MKYVMIKSNNFETPFVFPDTETHSDVAKRLNHNLEHVVSAGFCNHGVRENGEVEWACWGKSISLNIDSRGDVDTAIMNSMFRR